MQKLRRRLRKFLDESPAMFAPAIAFAVILVMLHVHESTVALKLICVYSVVYLVATIALTMLSAFLIGLLGFSKVTQSAEGDAAPVIQKTQ